jgi:putative hemolysin
MLFISVFSFVAVLFYSAMRASLGSALWLRLELESHNTTAAGKACALFIKETVRVSLSLKASRIFFLVCWGLYAFHLITHTGRTGILQITLFSLLLSCFLFLISDMVIGNLSRLNPYALLRLLSPFFLVSYVLFWPVTSVLYYCRKIIFAMPGKLPDTGEKRVRRAEDFEELVNSISEGNPHVLPEPEVEILQKALDFGDVKAGACMIPRSEVVAMEINAPVEELIAKFTATRLTRILIYRENIENIIGYVHSFELFRKPVSIISIIRPVAVVPETMPINDLLTLFIKQRRNIALVVDEYGGTSGILTMEDVIEELFGEIDDEHDNDQLLEKELNEKEYLFSARLEINYLNEKYGFDFPESGDYTTLGGFLVHLGEGIPRIRQRLFYSHYRFEVTEMNANRVENVKVIRK